MVIAVVGPTASGKSTVALAVARAAATGGRNVEIVAIDAFTIYRGMDIGTAKPSRSERAEIPHHLLDILTPSETITVAAFRDRARAVIAEVTARGAVPILVGGSGLYYQAVVDPLRFPPTDAAVRRRLDERWQHDPAAAHRELAAIDPTAASRIDPGNLRRTVRALEVVELTGEPFSAYDDGYGRYESIYPDLHVVRLEVSTTMLRSRIAARAEAMVADGLLEEVATLREAGPLSTTAAQAIGYAEAAAVLDGVAPVDELDRRIAERTWRYARRQRAWFRRDPRATSLGPAEATDALTRRVLDVR